MKQQFDYDEVYPWADVLLRRLAAYCDEAMLVGSIRRQCETVSDVEIALLPSSQGTLDQAIDELIASRMLKWDEELPRNGLKYKRLKSNAAFGGTLGVDLFIAQPANYGNTLAIRTGDKDFSRMLVTQRAKGGLMPNDLRQAEGFLWRGEEIIACPTEAAFFDAIGVRMPKPEHRDGTLARQMARNIVYDERMALR